MKTRGGPKSKAMSKTQQKRSNSNERKVSSDEKRMMSEDQRNEMYLFKIKGQECEY